MKVSLSEMMRNNSKKKHKHSEKSSGESEREQEKVKAKHETKKEFSKKKEETKVPKKDEHHLQTAEMSTGDKYEEEFEEEKAEKNLRPSKNEKVEQVSYCCNSSDNC